MYHSHFLHTAIYYSAQSTTVSMTQYQTSQSVLLLQILIGCCCCCCCCCCCKGCCWFAVTKLNKSNLQFNFGTFSASFQSLHHYYHSFQHNLVFCVFDEYSWKLIRINYNLIRFQQKKRWLTLILFHIDSLDLMPMYHNQIWFNIIWCGYSHNAWEVGHIMIRNTNTVR